MIRSKRFDLQDKVQYDHRTKEYKMIHDFCEEMMKTSTTEKIRKASEDFLRLTDRIHDPERDGRDLRWAFFNTGVWRSAVDAYLFTLLREQLMWLYCRKHMTRRNYDAVITWIQLTLADKVAELDTTAEITDYEEE